MHTRQHLWASPSNLQALAFRWTLACTGLCFSSQCKQYFKFGKRRNKMIGRIWTKFSQMNMKFIIAKVWVFLTYFIKDCVKCSLITVSFDMFGPYPGNKSSKAHRRQLSWRHLLLFFERKKYRSVKDAGRQQNRADDDNDCSDDNGDSHFLRRGHLMKAVEDFIIHV